MTDNRYGRDEQDKQSSEGRAQPQPQQGQQGQQLSQDAGGSNSQRGYGYGQSAESGQHDNVGASARQTGFRSRSQGQSQPGAIQTENHYTSWRDQQLSQHDRDYAEYRKHKADEFAREFDEWRRSRPQGWQNAQRGHGASGGQPSTMSAATAGSQGSSGPNPGDQATARK